MLFRLAVDDVDHRQILWKFLDRVLGELYGFLGHEHYPRKIWRVTARGLPFACSPLQLARLGDDSLDCPQCLGTINAVRRIFDFCPAKDSYYPLLSPASLTLLDALR